MNRPSLNIAKTPHCYPIGEGCGGLPAWACNNDARKLLAAIRLERPMISLATYRDPPAEQRYAGRNAALLRRMFNTAFAVMLDDLSQQYVPVEPGRPQSAPYRAAHDGLINWHRVNNADALIRRVLGDDA